MYMHGNVITPKYNSIMLNYNNTICGVYTGEGVCVLVCVGVSWETPKRLVLHATWASGCKRPVMCLFCSVLDTILNMRVILLKSFYEYSNLLWLTRFESNNQIHNSLKLMRL